MTGYVWLRFETDPALAEEVIRVQPQHSERLVRVGHHN